MFQHLIKQLFVEVKTISGFFFAGNHFFPVKFDSATRQRRAMKKRILALVAGLRGCRA